MWDGVTYVEPNHDPIIHEGREPATVVIINGGPAVVRVRSWSETKPNLEAPADIDIELHPGNTKSVNGNLIRVRLNGKGSYPYPPQLFAALGWKVVR